MAQHDIEGGLLKFVEHASVEHDSAANLVLKVCTVIARAMCRDVDGSKMIVYACLR